MAIWTEVIKQFQSNSIHCFKEFWKYDLCVNLKYFGTCITISHNRNNKQQINKWVICVTCKYNQAILYWFAR